MGSRQLITVLLSICLVACTTMQPVEFEPANIENGTLPAGIEAGDYLRVRETSGRTVKFKLVEVDGQVLKGTLAAAPHAPVEVNLADIESMEVQRAAPEDTRSAFKWSAVTVVVLFIISAMAASNI